MTEQTRTHFDIVVVGGGIAGLVAGLSAAETGATVAVVDSHAVGGRGRTTLRDGYHYNVGPHALYLSGHLRPFLQTHGLDPRGGVPDAKRVRLLREGRLWELSMGPTDIARTKLLRPRSRMRILNLLARLPRLHTERFIGMPWQEFLGNEPGDVAGVLATFVRLSTYVNAPARFDTDAALRQFQLALRGVRYVDGGWQTIVDSLRLAFVGAGGTVIEHHPVQSIGSDGRVTIETTEGSLMASAAIIAGLAPDAVERLTGTPIAGREFAGGVVHAAALDLALTRVHDGLVLGIDEPLYLSPHAPTAALAPTGAGLISLLRYVPDSESVSAGADHEQASEITTDRARLRALAIQAGIDSGDIVHERYMHRLVVANGFPSAQSGGLHGRPSVEASGIDGVFIAGDWVGDQFQLADASSCSATAAVASAMRHIGRRDHAST